MTSEREALVGRRQLGTWLAGPWTICEATTPDGDVWQVKHGGQVLATLPDWAGNLAQPRTGGDHCAIHLA
ncbi:hypothetical protein [Streptomyces rimosus]